MTEAISFSCVTCRLVFESADLQRAHFKCDWHKHNTTRKSIGLDPIDEEEFQKRYPPKKPEISTQPSSVEGAAPEASVKSGFSFGSDQFVFEDSATDMTMIDSSDCFFDGSKHEDAAANLAYMSHTYSFFFPYFSCLTDLDEAIMIVSDFVRLKRQCISCQAGPFKTVSALRHHMLDKGHTYLNLELHDELAEDLDKIYDIPEDTMNRSVVSVLSDGSLLLDTGKVVVNRSFFDAMYRGKQSCGSQVSTMSRMRARAAREAIAAPAQSESEGDLAVTSPREGGQATVGQLVPKRTLLALEKARKEVTVQLRRASEALYLRETRLNKAHRRRFRSSIVELYCFGK